MPITAPTPPNPDVIVNAEPLLCVGAADIDRLKAGASASERKRMRLCAHNGPAEPLHEMIIALARQTYIRPHKHLNKSESMHVIEGWADVVFFDDAGTLQQVIRLGDYASRLTFYYRISVPYYHTLLIGSDVFLVHETTNGPFNPSDTIYAPWAPEESDAAGRDRFLERVRRDYPKEFIGQTLHGGHSSSHSPLTSQMQEGPHGIPH